MIVIFYVTYVLIGTGNKSTSNVSPVRTKAASITYTKNLALNTVTISPTSPIEQASPTLEPTEVVTEAVTTAPSPTEVILAQNNSSASPSETLSPSITSQIVSPTNVQSLPSTGYVTNIIVIIGVSGLLILFAFIF